MWGEEDTDIAFVWYDNKCIQIDVEVGFANNGGRYEYTGPIILLDRIEHHFRLVNPA